MIDTPDQPQAEPDDPYAAMRNAAPWLRWIEDTSRYYKAWQDACDNIDRLYANAERLRSNVDREFQIFWANMEVVRPSIYARKPQPVVSARFKDRKPLIRHASEILERSLITSFEKADIDSVLKMVRDDLALYGRGVAWVRLAAEDKLGFEHVDRKDFLCDPGRKWSETGQLARRAWMTRKAVRERFEATSNGAWQLAQYSKRKDSKEGQSDDGYDGEDTAQIWEIWSKTRDVVVWVTEGSKDQVLDIRAPSDIAQLDDFFPCPPPAFGTLERGTLKPVPDFLFYKDQVEEINVLTKRMAALSKSLRMKGFYPGGAGNLGTAITAAWNSTDEGAILVPVDQSALFGDKSLKDSIIWVPIVEIVNAITALVALRRQLIEDVYQITGLSDIMRGATDPNETLGAQELKSRYGSIRISEKQGEMVRFARDMTRIAGEIMAENFSDQALMELSQYEGAPTAQQLQQQVMQIDAKIKQSMADPNLQQQAAQNPQMAEQMLGQAQAQKQKIMQTVTVEQSLQFLRDQRLRPFMLDIETDSTIQPDEDSQKKRAAEFMGAMGQLLPQLAQMIQMEPATAGFAGEMLKYGSKQFRASREMEGAIDELVETMKGKAGQPKPNPEQEKLGIEKQKADQQMEIERERLAMDKEKHQQEMTFAQDRADQDAASRQDEFMAKNGVPVPAGYSFEGRASASKQQTEAIVQGMAAQAQALQEGLAAVGEGMKALAAAQAAPRSVTTPDGRTFTATVGRMN